MIDAYIWWVILGSSLVTIVSRIVPFILNKKMEMPKKVAKWLSFVPICIFSALIAQGLIQKNPDGGLGFSVDWTILIALVPALVVAALTKSMIKTVFVGVVLMALVRFLPTLWG